MPKFTRSSAHPLLFNWHTKSPNLPARFFLKFHFSPSNPKGFSTLSWRRLSGKTIPPLQWIIYIWDCVTAHSRWFLPEDLATRWHKLRRYGGLCFDSTEWVNVVDLGIYRLCLIRYLFIGLSYMREDCQGLKRNLGVIGIYQKKNILRN